MINIFEFENYKDYVNKWITSRPKKGRGELLRISKSLRIHSTLVSHIFRGDKHLSLEQASDLTLHLGLEELETQYFLILVQIAKAGSQSLLNILKLQKNEIQNKALKIVNRVKHQKVLSKEDKSTFYSNWYYSAIRLSTSLPHIKTKNDIYKSFDLPERVIDKVLDFLVTRNLCKLENGAYSLGPSITHLENDSQDINRHHTNWRLQAMKHYPQNQESDLVFSAPLTIAKKDAADFRERLLKIISDLGKKVEASDPDTMMAFNIDFVKLI